MNNVVVGIGAFLFALPCGAAIQESIAGTEANEALNVSAEVQTETVPPESCLRLADSMDFIMEWTYRYMGTQARAWDAASQMDWNAVEQISGEINSMNEELNSRAPSFAGVLPDCRAGA